MKWATIQNCDGQRWVPHWAAAHSLSRVVVSGNLVSTSPPPHRQPRRTRPQGRNTSCRHHTASANPMCTHRHTDYQPQRHTTDTAPHVQPPRVRLQFFPSFWTPPTSGPCRAHTCFGIPFLLPVRRQHLRVPRFLHITTVIATKTWNQPRDTRPALLTRGQHRETAIRRFAIRLAGGGMAPTRAHLARPVQAQHRRHWRRLAAGERTC